ncbi:hypothetical protein E4U53_006270 [Claviceps sorghi]|nr:hypothetical protein E4U53_006270 [Claviceps sorghi]
MPPSFTRALAAFLSSPDPFRVLATCTPPARTRTPRAATTLMILDSSFNPPTTAHAQMARSALAAAGPDTRLLLLLAVRNADKGSPEDLATRLRLMEALARDLLAEGPAPVRVPVDVGVTKSALFADKARSVGGAGLVFLVGFDTLVRILDARYYADVAGALRALFAAASLRVTVRGAEREQRAYVEGLAAVLEGVGGDAAWAGRVELVEGVGAVSSSRVRDVVRRGGGEALRGLVGPRVRAVMEDERLYGSMGLDG